MSILDSAKRRYSTKVFDSLQKVSDADMETLKTIFQLSPSSINIQPWHVLIADSEVGKKQITQATQGNYAFNEKKILDASHVMVLCIRTDINQAHLDSLLKKEIADGRFPNEDILNMTQEIRGSFFAQFVDNPDALSVWASKQVYIALGNVLLAAADMKIDSVPIEGFDAKVLGTALGLKEKQLFPVVLAAFGYHSDEDFNANLPKSRFGLDEIFTMI